MSRRDTKSMMDRYWQTISILCADTCSRPDTCNRSTSIRHIVGGIVESRCDTLLFSFWRDVMQASTSVLLSIQSGQLHQKIRHNHGSMQWIASEKVKWSKVKKRTGYGHILV